MVQARPSYPPAGAGGTPARPGRSAKPEQDGEPKRYSGRESGGAACIGCRAYQSKLTTTGAYTGLGYCLERDRVVTAVYRGACGLYEFHRSKRAALHVFRRT